MKRIKTEFGTATINTYGYLRVYTRKEGNRNKMLHRLIYENNYGVTILPGIEVHHKDGNKLNNDISNLELIPKSKHMSLHNAEKEHSEKTVRVRSISNSRTKSSTGIYRVRKVKNKDCNQGFYWEYRYQSNGKRINFSSISLSKLKEKVISKGFEWIVLDEEKASMLE